MRAIIVDDEPDGIRSLKKMLELNCPEVEIVSSCTDVASAEQKVQTLLPDVVFLDIQMPGKTGIDMLADLKDKSFEVIFVTAHSEYLLQALQFSAADYLMKPVDEDRLVEAIQRVKKKLKNETRSETTETFLHNVTKASSPMEMRLCLPTQKGFTIIKLEEIVYCEAQRSYTVFRLLNNKSIMVSRPLFDYDSLLADTIFYRVHKSFLINLMHITSYTRGEGGSVTMSNGMEIEVSRRKKEQFLVKIKEFFKY